jgi:hypothetical protein
MTAAVRRLVLTARLRPGTRERALELAGSIAAQLETSGFEQLGVYLSEREVVFLIEAREAELLLREILDDPVRATEISPWLPLFDGPLYREEEVYYWSATPRRHRLKSSAWRARNRTNRVTTAHTPGREPPP